MEWSIPYGTGPYEFHGIVHMDSMEQVHMDSMEQILMELMSIIPLECI